MKTIIQTIMVSLMVVMTSESVLAASTVGRTDHSGILVWGFLGFCAVIVMAQLLPAILMTLGIFNSFKETDIKHKTNTTMNK